MKSISKRTKLISTFAAGLAGLMLSGNAAAQSLFSTEPAQGSFYISGYGGINFGGDADFSGVQDPVAGVPGAQGAPANFEIDFNSSRTFGGAIGGSLPFKYFYGILQPRLELEGSTFRQDVDSGSLNGGNQIFSGDLSGITILFNNYSDIKFRDDQVVVPYFGGGIGVAFLDSTIEYFPAALSAPNFALTGDETTLFGHFAAGVSVRLSEQLELYSEARLSRATNANFDRTFIANNGFSADVSDSFINFSIAGGIRFKF